MRILYLFALGISMNLIFISWSHAQNSIEHPQATSIPYIDQLKVNTVYQNLASTNLEATIRAQITDLEDKVNKAQKLYQIGVKQGKKNLMLGRVMGVVTDAQGDTYILDSRNNQVVVYDDSGNFSYSFGRGGPGPGEFQSPVDIEMDADSNIYVADRNNAIKKFIPENGNYEYETTFKIHIVPDEFCILGDQLYVRGVGVDKLTSNSREFKIIHQYSIEDKEYVTSFGQPYKSDNTFTLKQLSDGKIACHEESNTVITTFDMMPYLFGFSGEGNIQWVSKIDSYSQRSIIEKVENGQPSITLESGESSFDTIAMIQSLDDNYFILQTSSRPGGRNVNPSDIVINTSLVSIKNGEGAFLDKQPSQWMLSGITTKKLYVNGLLKNLYPSIIAYEY